MVLLFVMVMLAMMLATARGGRLYALGGPSIVRRRLLVTAALAWLLGMALTWLWAPLHVMGALLVAAPVLLFCWLNRRLPGALLIALGALANLVVVLLNGAMPVALAAAERAGAAWTEAGLALAPGHELLDGSTVLPWLGDIVPVAFPPWPQVATPGDLLIAAGAALIVVEVMLTTRRRPPGRHEPADALGAHETLDADRQPVSAGSR